MTKEKCNKLLIEEEVKDERLITLSTMLFFYSLGFWAGHLTDSKELLIYYLLILPIFFSSVFIFFNLRDRNK